MKIAADAGISQKVPFEQLIEAFSPKEEKLPLGEVFTLAGGGKLIGTGGQPIYRDDKTEPRPQLYTAVDPLTGKPIPGMALSASGSPVQTGERGGLKDLSQTEVDRIAALSQAENDLNTLEQLYATLGQDYGGPLSGRLRSAAGSVTGMNEGIVALENAVTAATPNLARGVFREVGVLTDEDIKRYKQLLPQATDSAAARKVKIEQLRKRIREGKRETMEQLRKAGRDVTGFEDPGPPRDAAVPLYDSEALARAAGLKTGDVFLMYDPQTASYRRARLK